jgi:hypothetical protein
MFNRKPKPNLVFDEAINELLARIAKEPYDPKETPAIVDQVTKLAKLRDDKHPKRPSPDTLILVTGNIIGIILILQYERVNVITSRAMSFVLKLR